MKKHNFYAGPAILPQSVMQKAAKAVLDFENSGLSITEISHRADIFVEVLHNARQLVKELLNLSDDHEVLFLSGGASTQFFTVPYNCLGPNQTAGYVDSGAWANKAIKEAKLFGNVKVLASSKDKNYSYIPKSYDIPQDLKYLHITSNNTIYGTQYHEYPDTDVPLVCDMSSDIFCKPIDADRFGIIYAGAQKNLGPAGTTVVIVKKSFLEEKVRELPTMVDYHTHIAKGSSFNTPPVFPIYVSMLTLKRLKEYGGVPKIAQENQEKADLLYKEIDDSPCFLGTTAIEDRSLMNVCFLLKDPSLESKFMDMANEAGCVGLKGHRSVGGFRASIYNAMHFSSVQILIDVMKSFAQKYG
jgi:phosphoserine aminotransferase